MALLLRYNPMQPYGRQYAKTQKIGNTSVTAKFWSTYWGIFEICIKFGIEWARSELGTTKIQENM